MKTSSIARNRMFQPNQALEPNHSGLFTLS